MQREQGAHLPHTEQGPSLDRDASRQPTSGCYYRTVPVGVPLDLMG